MSKLTHSRIFNGLHLLEMQTMTSPRRSIFLAKAIMNGISLQTTGPQDLDRHDHRRRQEC